MSLPSKLEIEAFVQQVKSTSQDTPAITSWRDYTEYLNQLWRRRIAPRIAAHSDNAAALKLTDFTSESWTGRNNTQYLKLLAELAVFCGLRARVDAARDYGKLWIFGPPDLIEVYLEAKTAITPWLVDAKLQPANISPYRHGAILTHDLYRQYRTAYNFGQPYYEKRDHFYTLIVGKE